MFLIEYREGYFVNAENISEIAFDKKDVYFCIAGKDDVLKCADEKYAATFVNNLQAINNNFSIETRYSEINKKDNE